jgi:hypothetical protein
MGMEFLPRYRRGGGRRMAKKEGLSSGHLPTEKEFIPGVSPEETDHFKVIQNKMRKSRL